MIHLGQTGNNTIVVLTGLTPHEVADTLETYTHHTQEDIDNFFN